MFFFIHSLNHRFQDPDYDIEGEYKQSWGMIYSSAEEARKCAEEEGMSEEEAVLPGKSCMNTFKGIMHFSERFCEDDVLLVFEGEDTYVSGHDEEYVAEYLAPVAVFSMKDALYFYENTYED